MIINDTYKYTPLDVALFIDWGDFKLSEAKKIEEDIWSKREECVQEKWRSDRKKWRQAVRKMQNHLEFDYEMKSINMQLAELGSLYVLQKVDYNSCRFEMYFKQICLRLNYSGQNYAKCKFRTVLTALGYKRRNADVIIWMKFSMEMLGISCNKKNNGKCDIADVNLDETVTFRLTNRL